MPETQKTVIIIAGPTAVGKTSVSIALAKHFQTEVISADSRQCYREMNIGVARPTLSQLSEIPHHFIASHSIHDDVTAAVFEKFALEKARTLFNNKNVIVMTGGSGLYIKAFAEGLDAIPAIPDQVRKTINKNYEEKGLIWLQQEVQQADPHFYSVGEIKNPHRLMRALEVIQHTGQSIIKFRNKAAAPRDFSIFNIGLHLPKEQLHAQIDNRVEQMMALGLKQEVQSLLPFQHLKSLQTVGYQELFTHFRGECTESDAVEQIKKNTRQYAKRQMTWFRKGDYEWMEPDAEAVIEFLKGKIFNT